MKTFLKTTSILLASLMITILSVVAVAWFFPSFFIHTKNLVRLLPTIEKLGVQIKWNNLELNAQSLSFFRKELLINAHGLCMEVKSQAFKNCFRTHRLELEVNLEKFPISFHVREATFLGGELQWSRLPSTNPERVDEKKDPVLIPRPPQFLEQISFEKIELNFSNLEIAIDENRIEGRLNLLGEARGQGSEWEVSTQTRFQQKGETLPFSAELRLRSGESLWFGPYHVAGSSRLALGKGGSLHADIEGKPEGNDLIYAASMNYSLGKRRFQGTLNGRINPQGIHANVSGTVRNLVDHLTQIRFKNCEVNYQAEGSEPARKQMTLHCPSEIRTDFSRLDKANYGETFERISLLLSADLKMEDLPKKPAWVSGNIGIQVDPVLRKIKQGEASAKVKVEGQLSDFPKNWDFDGEGKIEIQKFQKFVQMIKDSPFAIPAPFNSLKGLVALSFSGKGKLDGGERNFPVELRTRLSSPEQTVDIDGKGALTFTQEPEPIPQLDMKIMLTDVKLVLPELEKKVVPRLLPDPRISQFPKRERASRKKFRYSLEIRTRENRPVLLVSNLAKSEIPLSIGLFTTSEELTYGSIKISKFPIELYRRKGEVDHLALHMIRKSDRQEVDGEVKVFYTDYTIRILVMGLARSPEIKILSEPPLPEDQAIAVLLFGQPMETLTQNEAASVGSTRAAIADRAIGLASMYLLASTPVESVSYDPSSQQFSARLRLGDGTSLSVGTDMSELNQIGIRRRLGRHWTVTTYLEDPMDPVERTISAFLEWSAGY